MLKNLPIINQDLTSTDFSAVEGAYYRHIGSTNDTFVNGTIYRYQDGSFKQLGAGVSSGMQTLVGTLEKPLTVADFEFGVEYLVQGYLLFGDINEDHIEFNIASAESLPTEGISYTNGSIILKQKGYKFTDQNCWRHYLIINNAYINTVDEESMTFNILPRHGFYFTVPFKSTTEDGNMLESYSMTFTQAGFPHVNGMIGGVDERNIRPVLDDENAFQCGFYAPTQPGEEGQVLGAVESGHFAPT